MRTKIYYELKESPYRIIIGDITYVFSSLKNFNTFHNNWKDFVHEQNVRATVRNKMLVVANEMLRIRYYQTIEKRGFYLIIKGVDVTCQSQIGAEVNVVVHNQS